MNTSSNFEKCTEHAWNVLHRAQEEARRLQHHYIGTEHLLLSLVLEGQGVVVTILQNLGVEMAQIRSAVEHMLMHGEYTALNISGPTYSQQASHAILLAADEARRYQQDHIGTEHLLLGLLGEREEGVTTILGPSTSSWVYSANKKGKLRKF